MLVTAVVILVSVVEAKSKVEATVKVGVVLATKIDTTEAVLVEYFFLVETALNTAADKG